MSNAANASSGHSSPPGVISRPPQRASTSRSAAARSIPRLASVSRARSSLTRPRRTRSAARRPFTRGNQDVSMYADKETFANATIGGRGGVCMSRA